LAGEFTAILRNQRISKDSYEFPRVVIFRTIFVILGISGFALSKNSVDKKRYESMKVRERMRKANEGEYQVPETRRFEA
jgi:hypothetical protein